MGNIVRIVSCCALAIVAAAIAGCSCGSPVVSPDAFVAADAFVSPDAFVAGDACTPMADSPQRGMACTSSTECPSGYTCRTSFSAAMSCEISCTAASEACVCATGLSCEVPAGMATGICS